MADWTKVEVDLNQLLGPVNSVIETIDSVLVALITILNIVSAILDIIKVFLVGLLDPIRTLVELIIEEIRSLIEDLRQLGIYIHGDWNLLKADGGFVNVLGGYQAYERRMVARLLDRSDPGRPDFSSSSSALGVFLYVNSGDIDEILRAVRAILNFFGRGSLMGRSKGYSTPTTPEFAFGSDPTGLALFRGISSVVEEPDYISLTWSMPTGVAGKSFKTPTPKGFLVHVSTVRDGLEVIATIPDSEKSANPNEPTLVLAAVADPITAAPLRLYGGVTDLACDTEANNFSKVERPDPNSPKLFVRLDQNSPLIPPSRLQIAGKGEILGKTFYCKVPALSPKRIGGGTRFTAVLKKSDLPVHATITPDPAGLDVSIEETTSYFFRVRAVSKEYADLFSEGTLAFPASVADTNVRLYHVSKQNLLADPSGTPIVPEATGDPANFDPEVTFNSVSNSSGPASGQVPDNAQLSWRSLVQKALAVVLLTRPDLVEQEDGEFEDGVYPVGGELGFEDAGREMLGRYGVDKRIYRTKDPVSFRNKVSIVLQKINAELADKQPPPTVVIEALAADTNVQALTTWRWSDGSGPPQSGADNVFVEDTILESIGDTSDSFGIGANPYCRGSGKTKKALRIEYGRPAGIFFGPLRGPGFAEVDFDSLADQALASWNLGDGSADYSPVVYDNSSGSIAFCRNVLINQDRANPDQSVLAGVSRILQVAAATKTLGDGSWISIRLLPQALVPLDEILNKIDNFLTAVLDGLQGALDFIVQYIEAIQARIKQLQAFIEAIRALLNALQFFAIPSVSGLVFVEQGTSGIVSGLLSSENKPESESSDYGAGVVLVAGGLPTVLLEVLQLLFPSTEET